MAWYKNGKKWRECVYKDGKYDGKYEEWWDDGKKCREYMFIDGKNVTKNECIIQ